MGKINLQMYSFMDGTLNDNVENFKTASRLGYDGVELFGPNFQIPAGEMKELLAELGLEAVSLHAPSADQVLDMIPYAVEVGMKYIGIGMQPMMDASEVHLFAKKLNDLGEECKKNGLTLTYHNHTQEFLPCGSKTVFEVLMEETDPEYVSFELDCGWVAAAGANPFEILERYSGRIPLIHVKESAAVIWPQPPMDWSTFEKDENGAPIPSQEAKESMEKMQAVNCGACEGLVDWERLKAVADANGAKHYIVEREGNTEATRIDTLAEDIRRYRQVL